MKFLLKATQSPPTVMDGAYGGEGGVRDYTERQLPRKEGAHTKEEVKQQSQDMHQKQRKRVRIAIPRIFQDISMRVRVVYV